MIAFIGVLTLSNMKTRLIHGDRIFMALNYPFTIYEGICSLLFNKNNLLNVIKERRGLCLAKSNRTE